MVHERNLHLKRTILDRIQRVLHSEAAWLDQVRYELSVGMREEVINAWKLYVKYQRVRRNRVMNQYSLFLLVLQRKVDQARVKRA